jgi:hypothetical protein
MKGNILKILLFAFLLLGTTKTFARENMYWSINPMSCTPISDTLREQKYITTGGRVKFKDGVIGLISFICPIPPFNTNAGIDLVALSMDYYQDSFEGIISAKVRRANLKTGAVQDVVRVQSSRGGSPSSFHRVVNHSSTIIDLNDYTYWVQFTLKQDRIEMTQPDDISGGTPHQRRMAILNLLLSLSKR